MSSYIEAPTPSGVYLTSNITGSTAAVQLPGIPNTGQLAAAGAGIGLGTWIWWAVLALVIIGLGYYLYRRNKSASRVR